MAAQNRRKKARQFGLWAETLCRFYLFLTGWRIIERNLRLGGAEADIVATRRATLAFFEVKARSTIIDAANALTPAQQARLSRLAAVFLSGHSKYANFSVRFDLLLVAPWRLPVHIRDAWRPDG
jgi:putative endonuclease